MRLNGAQLEDIQNAILQAFDYEDLNREVRVALNVELENFSLPDNATQGVYDLLHETEQHGWTVKLLKALAEKRDENRAFQKQVNMAISILESQDGVRSQRDSHRSNAAESYSRRVFQALPAAIAGAGILAVSTVIDDVWEFTEEAIFGKHKICVEDISNYVKQGSDDLQSLNRNQLNERLAAAKSIKKRSESCLDGEGVKANLDYINNRIMALTGWSQAREVEAAINSFMLIYPSAVEVPVAEISDILVKANKLQGRLEETKEPSIDAHDHIVSLVANKLRIFTNSLNAKQDQIVLKPIPDQAPVMQKSQTVPVSVSVSQLDSALAASRAVGKVFSNSTDGTGQGRGTGFRVAQNLILTASHVLSSADVAASRFAIPLPSSGVEDANRVLSSIRFEPDQCLVSNESLDYTLVAIASESQEGLSLKPDEFIDLGIHSIPSVGEISSVIHYGIEYDGGYNDDAIRPRVSFRGGEILEAKPNDLHYTNSAGPGSSGAPVLNGSWQVIALHQRRVPIRNSGGGPTAWSHAGARIDKILESLKAAQENGDADVANCAGVEALWEPNQ